MPAFEEIGKKLVENGTVAEEVFRDAAEKARQTRDSIYNLLLESGEVDETGLIQFIVENHNIPYTSLENFKVEKDVLSLIPEDVARRFRVLPLFEMGNKLIIAVSAPLDVYNRDFLQALTKYRIYQVLAPKKEIFDLIGKLYITVDSTQVSIRSLGDIDEEDEEKETYLQSLIKEAEKAPVVKLVNLILSQAIDHKASDIHIEPFDGKIILRYRIDGILYEYPAPPLPMHRAIVSRIKIISGLDIAERRLPQSGRTELEIRDSTVDMRVSIMPTIHGENVVIRVLDKTAVRLELESLGFDNVFLSRLEDLISLPYGILLATGPTGSGKTSTLYSILHKLHTPKKKIITIEDPVEFDFEGLTQVTVREDIGLTFAHILRQVLRHDPDIVMVGEIRDQETAEIAIRAALTGHMVLSTLHTNDAASAVTRLIDMGVPPFLVSSTLNGAIAQRLARRLCPNCREEYTPGPEILNEIGINPRRASEYNFYKPGGCPRCNQTGYRGRLAIGELLVVNEHIRSMIGANSSSSTLKQAGIRFGMETMRTNAYKRFAEGVTSWEEVLAITASD